MNRWQAWAGRLRQRHSRIDAWRAQGAMVLVRGAETATPVLLNDLRSIVHMHTRLAISPRFMLSLRPAMATPMMLRLAPSAISARSAPISESAAGPASHMAMRAPSLRSPGIAPAAAFVPRKPAREHAMVPPLQTPPVHRSMRHREIASLVVAHAGEIASRLRRNVARHESPPPAPTAVLAAPQRAAATEVQAAVQAAAAHREADARRLAQPAPAMNVEVLTGMVIQQIDRRLVAYRERMGRG